MLCYEQPHQHPHISEKERDYLKRKIHNLKADKSDMPPTPWKAILTSSPVVALILSSVCSVFNHFHCDRNSKSVDQFQALFSWGFYIVNTDISKYINDVLHVSVRKNGIYSSLPKILSIFVSVSSGFVSDWMHEKRNMKLTTIRKLFVALGNH